MNRYFDHNATTPMGEAAKRAWLEAAERHWHNPSSLYREAGFAKQKLEEARERLAALTGCEDAERIVFTSGATESNNALFASLAASLPADARIAISAIEHPSVREPARAHFGKRVIEIAVNADGVVETEAVSRLIERQKPGLVSVLAANNECGTIQPWAEIAELCRSRGVLFHTDAAQWIGKMLCGKLDSEGTTEFGSLHGRDARAPLEGFGICDYITGSAHKFGGPKGCGFLVLRSEEERLRFIRGGPQESERRAGTENYPAVEAMVTALEHIAPKLDAIAAAQQKHRDEFIAKMKQAFSGIRIISENAPRLWNTVLMVMPRHENLKWLVRLTRRGFAISTGSACSSGKEGSSVVVSALGATAEELRRVVRVSGGWDHTAADWHDLAGAFAAVDDELAVGGR